jgi:hypothetical protein
VSRGFERTVVVRQEREQGTWLVALGGEHAWPDADALEAATSHVWAHAEHVIVDLTETSFLDSSVINWLLRAQLSEARTYALSIVEGPRGSFVGRAFTTMGLRSIFSCSPTRREVSAASPTVERRAHAEPPSEVRTPNARSQVGWVERAIARRLLPNKGEHDPATRWRNADGSSGAGRDPR